MNQKELKDIQRIGIMRLSALGDIIWMTPMIRRLLKYSDCWEIDLYIDKRFSSLLSGIERLNLIEVTKPNSFKSYVSLITEIRKTNYDLFLCAQANLRVNILYPFIRSKRKIGFDKKRGRDGHYLFVEESIPFRKEHSLEAFLGFTDYLGIKSNDIAFDWDIPLADLNWAKSIVSDKKTVVIHPVASSKMRTWDEKNYAELAERLVQEDGYQIILTGVGADQLQCLEVERKCGVKLINLAGKTSLKQLVSLFSQVEFVIAPDTGPIHLADGVGAKAIGLYVALPPSYTGPYNNQMNCVNAYPEAVKNYLGKDVTQVKWRKRLNEEEMMGLITVEQVLEKIRALI